ncbi:MAG: phosphotransferase [Candidatus Hodarchaeales archaeon]|jgi:Ser/Thr protein kinase RdoA (MazF antagonist)
MLSFKKEIPYLIQSFDVGKFIKLVKILDSGFTSDNYHVKTTKGNFVFRIIYDSVTHVNFSMNVHLYLANNGVKTPIPISTREGKFCIAYKNNAIAVQTFIEGSDFSESEKIDKLLEFYGLELGKIHCILLQMVTNREGKKDPKKQDTISYVRGMSAFLPENDYIHNQYQSWEQEISLLPENILTKAIIHGDVGPKDFFFKNNTFTGILDFNAATEDYLLFDIAPMMMYCSLFKPKRKREYLDFITAYLEESPMRPEELNWLHLILRTRWLAQIVQHQHRYVKGITRGSNTGQVEENLQGVVDGINFLKITNSLPKDYFLRSYERTL